MTVRVASAVPDSSESLRTFDHPLTCVMLRSEHFGWEELRRSLDHIPFVRVVADTQEPFEAVSLASRFHPKLVIAASHAYGKKTTEVLRAIQKDASPMSKILVVVSGAGEWTRSELATPRHSTSSIRWEDFRPEFVPSIVKLVVHTSITMFSAEISRQTAEAREHVSEELPTNVTKNEKAILHSLLTGMTHEAIARQHGISRRTVERTISNLCNKLRVSSPFALGWTAHKFHLLDE